MLITSTFYNVQCDRCRKEYEDYDYTWTADEHDAVERALDNDWVEIDGKHYCPDCVMEKPNAEYDDEYIPLPDIPKMIWRGLEAMKYITEDSNAAQLKETKTSYIFLKRVGVEDNYAIMGSADRTVLRQCLLRDFDVDYVKGQSGRFDKRAMILRITVPKYGNELVNVEPKFKVGDCMRDRLEAEQGIVDGLPYVERIENGLYICNNETIPIARQEEYEYPPMNRKES